MFKSIMLRQRPAGWWLKSDFIIIGGFVIFSWDFSFAKKYKPALT